MASNDTLAKLMEQAQVFASAWSLVGGTFDSGNGLADAEAAKAELREMIKAAIPAQAPAPKLSDKLLTLLKCLPEAPFKEHLKAEIDALAAQALPAAEPDLLVDALKDARSVILSLNHGKHHQLTIGDEPVYWQREEWIRWAIDEVLPKLDAAIAAPQAAQQAAQAAAGWREQHDRDSAELRSLCQARDEARRERDLCRVEIAGLNSSVGHMSALVDHQTSMLAMAMLVMKTLHAAATPDDSNEDMDAIIPGADFAKFVDGHARLLHLAANSPVAALPQPQPQSAQAKGDAA